MIKRIILLNFILLFLITGCSKPNKVVVSSHVNEDVVSEITTITCEPFEESNISKVKLYIDSADQNVEDDTAPWALKWNTINYEDNSEHILNVLAFGPDGDSTFSDTLKLIVDNSKSYPEKVAISNITLKNKGFNIEWEKSQDNDFSKYILEKGSNKSLSDAEVIYESNIITNNQFRDTKVNPLKFQYYRISVEDYVGYQTKGDIFSSNLEKVPSSVNVNSVQYDANSMIISWDRSSDSDFAYYSLYRANSLKGKKKRVSKITSKGKTSFTVNEYNPLEENWFWVEITDVQGYKATGAGKTNSIDAIPSTTQISGISYNDSQLTISWIPNSDADFQSYEVLVSNKNISDKSLGVIENQSQNSLSITEFDPTYKNNYKIVTTDYWGQKSFSSTVSNKIDKVPNQVSIKSLNFEGKSLVTNWTKSDEDNFDKYYVCHTQDLGASADTVAIFDNQNITSYKMISDFDPNLDNWVWIIVNDSRNQSSISPPQLLKNSPPAQSSLSLKLDDNDNLTLNWTKNNDADFIKYSLYHSQNPDLKNKNLIHETNNQNETSFNYIVTDHSRINYFQLVVEDIFGVQTNSVFISGVPTDLQVLLDIVLDNNLNVIPSELGTQVWENGRLIELSIGDWSDGGGTQIQTLPENFGNLSKLKNLWLSYNNLKNFPKSFTELSNLEILELRSNKISEIPKSLTELSSLKYLGLSYNKISTLPEWVNEFNFVNKFYLSHNNLAEIPESICEMNLNYKEMGNSFLSQNHLCVQFLLPDCVELHIGNQNCTE